MVELVLLVALTFSFMLQAIMIIAIGLGIKKAATATAELTEIMVEFFTEEIENYRNHKLGE